MPPKQLNPQLSDRANEAILYGLALEPEDRPQSVREWLQLLDINPAYPIVSPVLESVSTATAAAPPSRNWSSAVGMDYSQLRDLLAGGLWQEADRETASVMLQICGREKQGKLSQEDIENFPCRDLRAIDRLWVQYSSGRFGFSVQMRIWENVAENYDELGDRLGWRRDGSWLPYPDLTFNPTAVEGHLPSWGRRGRLWSLLTNRMKQCSL